MNNTKNNCDTCPHLVIDEWADTVTCTYPPEWINIRRPTQHYCGEHPARQFEQMMSLASRLQQNSEDTSNV